MDIKEIKRIHDISKNHITTLENNNLGQHVLSVQREYVDHVQVLLTANSDLIKALNFIDTHGIAVEESTHDELVEFIAELKQVANNALIKVGEPLPIKN